MILFGVERLMKYKLKTRLFAALALSGVSFYWPSSEVLAQNDFGFIRPAEPTRQDDQGLKAPPIRQANPMTTQAPPIVNGASDLGVRRPRVLAASFQPPVAVPPIVPASNRQATAKASTPKPFAASNVFNGAYVEPSAGNVGAGNVGYAQHLSSPQNGQQVTTKQVNHNESGGISNETAIGSGIRAQRDLPPIVAASPSSARRGTPQLAQPIELNELPPVLSTVQAATDSALPPVVRLQGRA